MKWKTKESGFSLKDKKSKSSLKLEHRFRNTTFKPIMIEEVSRNSMELSSRSEEKLIMLLQEMNNFDEMNNFMNNYRSKTGIFVKLMRSLNEMRELRRFQGSSFDTISRRRLVEDRDTILELTGKIQELQHEINCMNDSRDFKDAESVRSGQSHVTSQPVSFPPHPVPGGMLSRSLGKPSKNGPPSIGDTHGLSGNVFANPVASSSAPYPQGKFPTPTTFACWKIRFKIEERTCSQFPTEAMQWIKEVELVDSVDDLKSSCSVRGIQMPNFELLDARLASALNRIIHNTQFKRKVSQED